MRSRKRAVPSVQKEEERGAADEELEWCFFQGAGGGVLV
jgi:hypothetical protein